MLQLLVAAIVAVMLVPVALYDRGQRPPGHDRLFSALHAIVALGILLFLATVLSWFRLQHTSWGPPLDWCFDHYCHRKVDRCLTWLGEPMPVCARCFGVICGYLAGGLLAMGGGEKLWFWRIRWTAIPIAQMGASWLLGVFDLLPTSWHWERVAAGFLGGLGGYIVITRIVMMVLCVLANRRTAAQNAPT